MKVADEGNLAIPKNIGDVIVIDPPNEKPHDDLTEFLNGSKLKAINANFYYYKALLNGDLNKPDEEGQHNLLNNINIFYNQAVNFLKDEGKFTEENLEKVFDAFRARAGLQPLEEPLLSLLVEINQKIINLDLPACVNLIKNNLGQDSDIQSQSIKEALNDLANEHLTQLKKIWNTFTSKLLPEQVESITDQNLVSDIQQVSDIVIRGYFSELDEKAQTIIDESTIGQTYADYLEQDSDKITQLVNALNKAIMELDLNHENTLIALIDSIARINSTLESYMTRLAQTQAIEASLRPVMIASLKAFIKDKGLNKVTLPNNQEIEVSKCNLKNLAMLNASLSKIMQAKDQPEITKLILDQQKINLPEAFNGENQDSIFAMTSTVIFGRVQRLTDFLGPYGLEGILDNSEALTTEFQETEKKQNANVDAIVEKHKIESDLQKLFPIVRAWKKRKIAMPVVDEDFKKFDENAFSSCIHFLGQDPFIKYGLEFVQDDVDLHKNLPKSKITTFEQIEKIALGEFLDESGQFIRPMKKRPLTVQAHFKKTISTVKYTLTQEEIDLLNKATGLDLTMGNKSKITFTTAIELIETEIRDRNTQNRKKLLFKSRTGHLEAALEYLRYYEIKYKMTQEPEERLRNNQHRNHKNFTKGSEFRKKFSEASKRLWFPYKENRAIKKLKKILDKKYHRAAKLKEHAEILKDKAIRNENVYTNLTLKKVYIEGKEGKLPGKFFDSIIETDRKELEQRSYNLWLTSTEQEASLFKQLVYTDLRSRIKAVNKHIEAFIENSKLFKSDERGQILLLQEKVKILAKKEFEGLQESPEKMAQKTNIYINELRFLEQAKLTKENCIDLQSFATKLNTIFELIVNQYKDNLMTAFLEDRKHTLKALYTSVIQTARELDLNAHIFEPAEGKPFNPRCSENALKVVGQLVFDVKVTKKELERNANIFIKLQNATISAINKIVSMLEDMENQSKKGMDPKELVDEAIKRNEVTSHITRRSTEEIEKWSHHYFLDYEFSTISNELNKLRNKENLKEAIPSMIVALKKELEELKQERDYNQGRIKALVDNAIETSKAITHLADHATTSLGIK